MKKREQSEQLLNHNEAIKRQSIFSDSISFRLKHNRTFLSAKTHCVQYIVNY